MPWIWIFILCIVRNGQWKRLFSQGKVREFKFSKWLGTLLIVFFIFFCIKNKQIFVLSKLDSCNFFPYSLLRTTGFFPGEVGVFVARNSKGGGLEKPMSSTGRCGKKMQLHSYWGSCAVWVRLSDWERASWLQYERPFWNVFGVRLFVLLQFSVYIVIHKSSLGKITN